METAIGFFSPRQALNLKRDYRILRAKVLKILDQKFFHPSKDVIQYEAKLAQVQTAFKKIKDMEYLSNPENSHKAPKILDYNFYNPTLKSLKYGGKPEKTDIVTRDLEVLTIENLCKYLSSEEIELVCEDPIYFLGRGEYRENTDLNDHKGWNKQLVNVHKRKEREDNWKETMESWRITTQTSPRKEVFDVLSHRDIRSPRDLNFETKRAVDQKNSIQKIQLRKIQARTNQMRTLVKLRQTEDNQTQRGEKDHFEFALNDKVAKVMEKKAEVLKMKTDEKKFQRVILQDKLDRKEKERETQREIAKISQLIDYQLKEKVIEEQKKREFQIKTSKARRMIDFNNRKRFLTRTLEYDAEYTPMNQLPMDKQTF